MPANADRRPGPVPPDGPDLYHPTVRSRTHPERRATPRLPLRRASPRHTDVPSL